MSAARATDVTVHLESGDDAVMLAGVAAAVSELGRLTTIDAAYLTKHRMRLADQPGDLVVYRVTQDVALGWREQEFPGSATRWRFARAAGP